VNDDTLVNDLTTHGPITQNRPCPDGLPGCEAYHAVRACSICQVPWPCPTAQRAHRTVAQVLHGYRPTRMMLVTLTVPDMMGVVNEEDTAAAARVAIDKTLDALIEDGQRVPVKFVVREYANGPVVYGEERYLSLTKDGLDVWRRERGR
jgi:hypothetical protein